MALQSPRKKRELGPSLSAPRKSKHNDPLEAQIHSPNCTVRQLGLLDQ